MNIKHKSNIKRCAYRWRDIYFIHYIACMYAMHMDGCAGHFVLSVSDGGHVV